MNRRPQEFRSAFAAMAKAQAGLALALRPKTALPRNLEAAPVVGHAVVGADHPILLNAENVLDRTPDIGHEGRAWLGRGHRKARVVVGNETFFKVAIAPRNRPDFCEPQF